MTRVSRSPYMKFTSSWLNGSGGSSCDRRRLLVTRHQVDGVIHAEGVEAEVDIEIPLLVDRSIRMQSSKDHQRATVPPTEDSSRTILANKGIRRILIHLILIHQYTSTPTTPNRYLQGLLQGVTVVTTDVVEDQGAVDRGVDEAVEVGFNSDKLWSNRRWLIPATLPRKLNYLTRGQHSSVTGAINLGTY